MEKIYLELQDRETFNEEGEETIIQDYEQIVPFTNDNEDKTIREFNYALDGEAKNIFCDRQEVIFTSDTGEGEFANESVTVYMWKERKEPK